MMEYDVDSATAILGRTPGVLRALLQGLPDAWLDAPEKPGAWTPREVACHLADLEPVAWLPRVRTVLSHGNSRPVPAVDRDRFQDRYAGTPLPEVLDDFQHARLANLRELAALQLDDAALSLAGLHATLGEIRVSQILATWVVHDLTHLAQITRTLAAQYREAVGPFSEFLSILRSAAPE
ncbi:MAG TPA: DinB family protein [Longimicrobium sp.]|nr:DinB family protein [Longimicrobium sp.]